MILLRNEGFPRKWLSTQQLWPQLGLFVSICRTLSREFSVCVMQEVLEGICEISAGFSLLVIIVHLFTFSVYHMAVLSHSVVSDSVGPHGL